MKLIRKSEPSIPLGEVSPEEALEGEIVSVYTARREVYSLYKRSLLRPAEDRPA